MTHPCTRTAATLALTLAATAAAIVLGLGAAAVTRAADAPAPSRQDYRDRYGVLVDHNIFLKERGRPATPTRTRGSASGSSGRSSSGETKFVLTGIVLEEGQYRAYVEDVPRSKLLRLSVGDTVSRGRVEAIEINSVLYGNGTGAQTWVEIGQNLTGAAFTAAATASTTGPSEDEGPFEDDPATTAPSTTAGATGSTPAIDPNDPNLTFEQKMKLRRLQGK